MNYEPMWAVVDAHRRCADELERTLRELTGDQPVLIKESMERDDIELYSVIADALVAARNDLLHMADREGQGVRRRDASRLRVHANRCDKALDALWKSANQ